MKMKQSNFKYLDKKIIDAPGLLLLIIIAITVLFGLFLNIIKIDKVTEEIATVIGCEKKENICYAEVPFEGDIETVRQIWWYYNDDGKRYQGELVKNSYKKSVIRMKLSVSNDKRIYIGKKINIEIVAGKESLGNLILKSITNTY